MNPNEVRLVPMTNYEIIVVMNLLKKVIPDQDEQQTVVNIVDKLHKTLRQ